MSNDFYTASGAPSTSAAGSSATMRAEFDLIEDMADKLPTLTAKANLPVFVNSSANALESKTAADAKDLLGVDIDMWTGTATGTKNALALTPDPAITVYAAGQRFTFKAGATANDAATTVAISGLSTVAVQVNGAACAGGEIAANQFYEIVLDTTTTCQLKKVGRATPAELGATATGDDVFTAATAADARTSLGADSAPRVMGLLGNVNAATPLTQFDLSANAVVLRNATGGTVTRYVTGTITNDLGLAGVTANGRDQAGAFTASSWVYLYFIWNGTTLATVSSAAVPTTGPTLPTGYTHWAFATALRWNASSNIIPAFVEGAIVFYDIVTGGVSRIIALGAATSMTTVNCSSLIPPITRTGLFNFILTLTTASPSVMSLVARRTGSMHAGINICKATTQVAGQTAEGLNVCEFPVNASQQVDYSLSASPSSGGANIDVIGFKVPNGGS